MTEPRTFPEWTPRVDSAPDGFRALFTERTRQYPARVLLLSVVEWDEGEWREQQRIWAGWDDEAPRRWLGPVTDYRTGDSVMIRPAKCGADCYCAALWKPAQAVV